MGLLVLAGVGTGAYFLGRWGDSGGQAQSTEVAAGTGTTLTGSGSSSTEMATITSAPDTSSPTTTTLASATTTTKATATATTKAPTTPTTEKPTTTSLFLITQPTFDIKPIDTWTRVETTDPHMIWLGNWEETPYPPASGGSYALAYKYGQAVRIYFNGDGWRVRFVTGPNNGIVNVSCDGVFCSQQGDYYAPAWGESVYSSPANGWTPGTHYVDIAGSGDKNPSSLGIYVMFDAFEVRNGSVIAAP